MKILERDLLKKFGLFDELMKIGKKENFSKEFRDLFTYVLNILKDTEKVNMLIKSSGTRGFGIEHSYLIRYHNLNNSKTLEIGFSSNRKYEIPIKYE